MHIKTLLSFKQAFFYTDIMHLTTFTDYSMRCLMYLAAEPDRFANAREIADHYGISYNHVVKVVHKLAQLGYVNSTKGKGGGLRLAKDPATIRLGDLAKQTEPNMFLVECFDKKNNTCKITGSCTLKHYLYEANTAFIETLNKYTLKDTVSNKQLQKDLS